VYQSGDGRWHVDKVFRGLRLRQGGFPTCEEASEWLASQLGRARRAALFGERPRWLFSEAAARYLSEGEASGKATLRDDIYLLRPVVAAVGGMPLDMIHDGTIAPFVRARLATGVKHKTINLALSVVRRILNLAARRWRDDSGLTWLASAPLLTFLPLSDAREPRPLAWDEQRRLLSVLPEHLRRMVLFALLTGVREAVVCGLCWDWERVLPGGRSLFEVPRTAVKGRRSSRWLVLSAAAQEIVEACRGEHHERVFCYRGAPVAAINNTAWRRARYLACLADLRVHDLRHTVGVRLRAAGVREETVADVLWHTRRGVTAHYSPAAVEELSAALALIEAEGSGSAVPVRRLRLVRKSP
jgi:integrase